MKYVVTLGDARYEVEVTDEGVTVNGTRFGAVLHRFDQGPLFLLELEGQRKPLVLEGQGRGRWIVASRGDRYEAVVVDERIDRARRTAGSASHRTPPVLTAPMPGLVVRVPVSVGDVVEQGASLVVLEAMKMENELKATGRAVVDRVEVRPGQPVEKGEVLVRFRDEPPSA